MPDLDFTAQDSQIESLAFRLTDKLPIIEPLLPNKPRGVPRSNDRKVLNSVYWRLRTGLPWADIPERYGPATTCDNRFVRWARIGVWDRIFEAISKAYDGWFRGVGDCGIVRPFSIFPTSPTLPPSLTGTSAGQNFGATA